MRMIAGLLAVLILAGCSGKDKVPSGILPKEKMENILWDMVQADQYSAVYLAKDSARINIKTENLRLYQEVFRLHGISREEFRKSFQYYEDRPDVIRVLFDSLLSRGNRLRTESYNRPAPAPVAAAVTAPVPPVKSPISPVPAPVKTFAKGKDTSSRQKGKLPVP